MLINIFKNTDYSEKYFFYFLLLKLVFHSTHILQMLLDVLSCDIGWPFFKDNFMKMIRCWKWCIIISNEKKIKNNNQT